MRFIAAAVLSLTAAPCAATVNFSLAGEGNIAVLAFNIASPNYLTTGTTTFPTSDVASCSVAGDKCAYVTFDPNTFNNTRGVIDQLAVGYENSIYYFYFPANTFSRNGVTDTLATSFFSGRLTVTGSANAPEPASWMMMIAGFGAIGGLMRRRNPAADIA